MLPNKAIKFPYAPRAVVFAGSESNRAASQQDVENARKEGYQRGFEEASMLVQRQLLDQRADVLHLQQKTFRSLASQHESLISQLSKALPELAMEAVRRVIAEIEIDRELVVRIINDLLVEVHPGPGALDIALSDHDAKLIEGIEESFRSKYPGIRFSAEPELQPGDCVVRSRFGTIDGRVATKLKTVEALLR